MQTGGIGVGVALLAGLASFVSPCVLPLVPTYVAYLAGESFAALRAGSASGRQRLRAMSHAVAFVVGFGLVFVAFGLAASALGQFLSVHATAIRKVSGVLVVAMGLHLIGWMPLPWLQRPRRLEVGAAAGGVFNSWLVGVAFAAGWTPCVGPVLGGILALAGNARTLGAGAILLFAYTVGLGIPFLATAAFLDRFHRVLARLGPHLARVQQASGLLLIGIGLMIYTNTFLTLSGYFNWGF